VYDGAFAIDDQNGTGGKALERGIEDPHAKIVEHLRVLEGGAATHVFDTLGPAEATGRRRQIGGDTQDGGSLDAGRALVERADASGAGGGVDGREDVEHQGLTGEISRGDLAESGTCHRELGRLAAHFGKSAVGLD